MAANIPPSLRSSLERLKNGGAVNGVMLGWRRQVLVNSLPYEEFRAERLLHEALDARGHFASGGDRDVQTLWFGYDTVHILVLFRGDLTLTLLHARAEEGDFLLSAAGTCLEDVQLIVQGLLQPETAEDGEANPDHAGELPEESSSKTNFLGSMA